MYAILEQSVTRDIVASGETLQKREVIRKGDVEVMEFFAKCPENRIHVQNKCALKILSLNLALNTSVHAPIKTTAAITKSLEINVC